MGNLDIIGVVNINTEFLRTLESNTVQMNVVFIFNLNGIIFIAGSDADSTRRLTGFFSGYITVNNKG